MTRTLQIVHKTNATKKNAAQNVTNLARLGFLDDKRPRAFVAKIGRLGLEMFSSDIIVYCFGKYFLVLWWLPNCLEKGVLPLHDDVCGETFPNDEHLEKSLDSPSIGSLRLFNKRTL